jgi:hypothetical protein
MKKSNLPSLKRLAVRTETLRELARNSFGGIAGGVTVPSDGCTNNSCWGVFTSCKEQ